MAHAKGDEGGNDEGRLFVVTYRPMVVTEYGRRACLDHGIPPMVDGSVRREPDLEHPRPSISCLCRTDKFAPRLRAGDRVVYLTTKGRYGDVGARGAGRPHWRLAAVLRVVKLFDTHAEAAAWYAAQGLDVPNNCMVPGNPPVPLAHSHMLGRLKRAKAALAGPACVRPPAARKGCGGGACGHGGDGVAEDDDDAVLLKWDRTYQKRARAHGRFVACEPVFRELSWDAPVVHGADLKHAFGKVPGTRNPGALPAAGLRRLLTRLGIRARL